MNSQYNFSYSGSDVKALIKSTDSNTAYKVLNTLTTVSFSVNEQKTPVRRLGRRHVVGFTKAIRTIAGTMVLTVLKGHPLTELYTIGDYYKAGEMGQGIHRPNSYHFATNVPPFDLKLIYQTEHNSNYYAELVIKGIEIISQSIVTSVNDMITECVLQFVARDYDEFINHVSGVTEQSHERIKVKMILDELQNEEQNKAQKNLENFNLNRKFDPSLYGFMGTVPDAATPLYVDDVSLESLKQEQIQDWLLYQSETGGISSSMPTSSDSTQKLLNGVTKTEQNVIEEKGTLE